MNVIGISGLHNMVEFKRRELPDLSEREYRVCQGFDSAAALVVDGAIRAAAAEERFTGEKATGRFPREAFSDCLRLGGLKPGDVDIVAHGFAYQPSELDSGEPYLARRYRQVYDPQVQLRWLDEAFPGEDWQERFVAVPHHLAHAASAYYVSGYDEALVLVADGMGETESLTVAVGSGNDLDVVATIPAMHSLGTLYGVFTLYLGFEMMLDEYKVMGLAPFGDRRRYYQQMMQLVRLGEDGRFTIPLLARDTDLVERETHRGVLAAIAEQFGPARAPGSPIEQRHRDIAAAVQAVLETCLLHVLRAFCGRTGLDNLCFAGGVALNCTANGVIARSRLFRRMFVPPGAGDDGSAVGAALYAYAKRGAGGRIPKMTMPYWGPSYTDAEVEEAAAVHPECVARALPTFNEVARESAAALEAGAVVAWFQNEMEFGPRALGNRSILADPREERMRDHINALIKRREDFRPFAPVVVEEAATEIFEIDPGTEEQYAHMLFTTRTRPAYRERLGAVTHIDGSARVQVVSREQNPRLWELLHAFGRRTGLPVLLNTSFNLRSQPVVRTPPVAVDTFLRGGLDLLVMNNLLVSRRVARGKAQ